MTEAFKRKRYTCAFAVVCLCSAMTLSVGAREIHYGAVSDSALLECDKQHWRGRLDESAACYVGLLDGDTGPAVKAEAAWALNDMQQANRWFQKATGDTPDDVATLVRWGDLFAETHQQAEAMNIYEEALSLDAENAYARLGAARVLAGSFDDEANTYLEALLSNKSLAGGARIGAWLLVARVALENSNFDEASSAMAEAEALIERGNWPPLQLYALRASADLLKNVSDSQWTEMSLEYNPHYGDIYATTAHFYVVTRRYRDAIEQYQKAVDIQPNLASAHEELGVNLLRDNQMSRARKHLETAHDVDPFSPKAVNTLRLLDSFKDFRIVIDPEPAENSDAHPITLRLHKDEADVIAPYAIQLTRDSIAEFTERYDFELKEPVVIEMYPDHEDFAVRTAGMPGLGILGATFGYVVAMDSPSGRPAEQFQWGTTLWHEMAHVFTLEASNHLVPRWFSEGVSVLEEWRSGPNPGVRIPMSVYTAIKDDRLLPVAELDEGFMRPSYEGQVIVSYMQAGLVCLFVDQQYGAESLQGLLYQYRDGLQTAEAIEAVLGVTPTQFDSQFEAFVKKEHGAILDHLDDWQRTQQSIAEKVSVGDWQEIVALAQHLLDLLPSYVEPDSPYLALAKAHEELGQVNAAREALQEFWQRGGFDPNSLKKLSGWFYADGQVEQAAKVLQSVNMVAPLDSELHGSLGELLLEAGMAEAALQEFEVAFALNPHDKASAYFRVARAQRKLGDNAASQASLLQALEVAPNFRPAQKLLLEIARSGSPND